MKEDAEHLFFTCPIARFVWRVVSVSLWRTRNTACFDHVLPRHWICFGEFRLAMDDVALKVSSELKVGEVANI